MKKTTDEIHKNRPTSPHLSIYKMQISTLLSVGHRISGMGLFFMLVTLSWWFILWVLSKFDPSYLKIFDNIFIKCLLALTIYGFFFHLCTGIRHLIWDTGRAFSIKSIDCSGLVAIIVSLTLTTVFWIYVL